MRLHVGCAMWHHKAWLGRFLPRSVAAGERLGSYAGWCNAVEGNTTFYATPPRGTVQSWARQTDPQFRFVVKLPKAITHERRLSHDDGRLRSFLEAIEPLGPRAHALWVQLPGSFGPDDVAVLERFLRRLPGAHRCAVEVRHRAFFDEPRCALLLEKVLSGVGAEWIPFDTTALFAAPPGSQAEREAWTAKPRMPRRTRALTDRPIVRYLGRDATAATVRGWSVWLDVVQGWLAQGRSPTVFIHTPDNAEALMLARRFHEQVRSRLPRLQPLPEPTRDEPLTLF